MPRRRNNTIPQRRSTPLHRNSKFTIITTISRNRKWW